MPEMRYDPVHQRWVVFAPERAKRPSDFVKHKDELEGLNPFVEGNEDITPPEILAVRDPKSEENGKGWKIRVVSNKYPAFKVEGDLEKKADGIYDSMNAIGAHEAIIETPDPESDFALLDYEHLYELGKVYRSRMTDLMKDRRLKYVTLLKNHRRLSGASLSHSHSQIAATPVIPPEIITELGAARKYFQTKERCLFCDLIDQEMKDRSRIVDQSENFIVIAPYASRFPFEMWILPKVHQHDFCLISDDYLREFMNLLQESIQRLKITLDNPPYNFVLHSAPNTNCFAPKPYHWGTLEYDWHWHLEILPRISNLGGFEIGTGFYINSTMPEQTADILGSVKL
jgi:UDPglucose--hexose-1-phosphate uridylyltransferase